MLFPQLFKPLLRKKHACTPAGGGAGLGTGAAADGSGNSDSRAASSRADGAVQSGPALRPHTRGSPPAAADLKPPHLLWIGGLARQPCLRPVLAWGKRPASKTGQYPNFEIINYLLVPKSYQTITSLNHSYYQSISKSLNHQIIITCQYLNYLTMKILLLLGISNESL